MHQVWTRAELSTVAKETHEIFPKDLPQPRQTSFVPSYEKEPPAMSLLLGWEYGRLWLKEHKQSIEKETSKQKPYFVESDFSWWVSKRTVVLDRRQIFTKKKQNPHVKNCNLTAFALSKINRLKYKEEEAAANGAKASKSPDAAKAARPPDGQPAPSADAEKAKICNCKDCKQRRTGGQATKRTDHNHEDRRSTSIPWY
ncbi:PREDICTED: uncharacterized protein LOC108614355 [Drosophila arizonae]|uniref:Uncharacterized protein LOC108614355 n=1 Tax=Drosophila arizonae TaxID=7263 RepID=A0ABM1P9Q4_DROAR|nr:PREDICTED: uncharacterized protein LOC108614355 [Drosophila arizonae]